jgi:hypothetical protein
LRAIREFPAEEALGKEVLVQFKPGPSHQPNAVFSEWPASERSGVRVMLTCAIRRSRVVIGDGTLSRYARQPRRRDAQSVRTATSRALGELLKAVPLNGDALSFRVSVHPDRKQPDGTYLISMSGSPGRFDSNHFATYSSAQGVKVSDGY